MNMSAIHDSTHTMVLPQLQPFPTSTVATAVVICDTQPIAVEGLRWLLGSTEDLRLECGVTALEAASAKLEEMPRAIVVVDKGLGIPVITDWLHGHAAATSHLGGMELPNVVIWGAGISEAEALKLLQAGVRGILRRSATPANMLLCLRTVASGGTWMEEGIFGDTQRHLKPRRSQLTERERQVTELVERGMRNRDIARSLGIQTGTVKIHLKHIFEKTGVRGRYGLALTGLKKKGALSMAVAAA